MAKKTTPQNKTTHTLPEVGFIRLATVLALIPVGKTSWYNGVKSGKYPQPVKLGFDANCRTVAWKVEDIRALIESINKTASEKVAA